MAPVSTSESPRYTRTFESVPAAIVRKFAAVMEGIADDVRRQDDQHFLIQDLVAVIGKQIFRQRHGHQAGNSVLIFRFSALDQAAQDAYLAFFQPNIVLDLVLRNDRLVDSADIAVPAIEEMSTVSFMLTSLSGCTLGVTSTFTPTSRYWNCVFTSGIYNACTAAHAYSYARLEAAGRYWNPLADFQ